MACAAASVDGLYVAIVRDGELSLYTVDPFAEIARTQLAPRDERTIAFVGRQILVYDTTCLTVFSMARLAVTAQVELAQPARLLATSHHYALLARDSRGTGVPRESIDDTGDTGELSIASCTSEGTAISPTRTPGVAERAVGLEQAKFLVWSKKGPAEIWDATSRLPTARVGLELPPDTIDVGITGKHRSVWIATSGGDLITSRLSDGKATVAALPKQPHRIVSHPSSAWLVVDFDGEPHAVNTVLRTWQRLDFPAGRTRALAPSIGAHAYVIVDEGREVARYEIGTDAAPRGTHRLAVGAPLPDDNEVVAPTLPAAPVQRVEARRVEITARAEIEPPRRDSASSLASRFAHRADPKRPTSGAAWHEPLWQWAKRVLGDAPATELPAGSTPLTMLADRAQLDVPARRILMSLYAEWLAGRGDAGLAASKLVEIAGPTGWQEALGSGQLGQRGLVSSRVGRCVLARAVGAFLDGRDAEHVRRVDGVGERTIADGAYRTHASHDDIARVLGTIAIGDGETARLEAWLRGWPFVTRDAPTELRPGELVIVSGDPAGLPDLPGV